MKYPLPPCGGVLYLQVKCRPSKENQTQNPQQQSGRKWCDYADLCFLPLFHRKREGYPISCKKTKNQQKTHRKRQKCNYPMDRTSRNAHYISNKVILLKPSECYITVLVISSETHSMNMMTPTAQQSTGRPYRWRATTSGAEKQQWMKQIQNVCKRQRNVRGFYLQAFTPYLYL